MSIIVDEGACTKSDFQNECSVVHKSEVTEYKYYNDSEFNVLVILSHWFFVDVVANYM